MSQDKQSVYAFWNQAACGEALYLTDTERASYAAQAQTRYALEPYIRDRSCRQTDEAQGRKASKIR